MWKQVVVSLTCLSAGSSSTSSWSSFSYHLIFVFTAHWRQRSWTVPAASFPYMTCFNYNYSSFHHLIQLHAKDARFCSSDCSLTDKKKENWITQKWLSCIITLCCDDGYCTHYQHKTGPSSSAHNLTTTLPKNIRALPCTVEIGLPYDILKEDISYFFSIFCNFFLLT